MVNCHLGIYDLLNLGFVASEAYIICGITFQEENMELRIKIYTKRQLFLRMRKVTIKYMF